MTPGQQQRKDAQDAARRQQQADERIRELEQQIKRLRSSLASIKRWLHHMPERNRGRRWEEADWHVKNALDGGGDSDA